MTFWNNFTFPSPIDDILKRPSFTLQDLLDEDEVVVDTRNQKQDLLAFLTTKENVSQLITYVVDEPPSADPPPTTAPPSTTEGPPGTTLSPGGPTSSQAAINIKFRYPVVSCEILSSEMNDIERVLLDNEELLDRIFSFFDKPKVNMLLANLVVKVAKAITSSKMEPMFNYLKRKVHYIDGFINHLEATAVTDFFTRLISMDGDVDGMTTQQWLTEMGFVEKLIGKLGRPYVDIHSDVAQAIIDIMVASPWGTPIMNRMVEEETSKLLFKTVINSANPGAFKYGMKVFNKLLRGLSVAQEDNPDSDEDEDKPRFTKPDPLGPLEQLPAPVQVLAANLDRFCELLKTPLAQVTISDQSLYSYEAFGFDRMVILEMVDILLDLNYMAINKALLNSELFNLALDMIFQFSHNNFCHRSTEVIFVKFLENSGQEAQLTFLDKTKLAKKLVDAEKSYDKNEKKDPTKPSPLYKPYLHRIVNSIGEIAERSTYLKNVLDEVEGWNDLLSTVKEERKKLETASAGAKGLVEGDEPAYFQPATLLDPTDNETSDSYEEGRDDDDEDLNLEDDQDMDSTNDADDYDADQAEILLTKQEIEASA